MANVYRYNICIWMAIICVYVSERKGKIGNKKWEEKEKKRASK